MDYRDVDPFLVEGFFAWIEGTVTSGQDANRASMLRQQTVPDPGGYGLGVPSRRRGRGYAPW
jgi:hypothetical protein